MPPRRVPVSFAAQLLRARDAQGMNRDELAVAANVLVVDIRQIEEGRGHPSRDFYDAIGVALPAAIVGVPRPAPACRAPGVGRVHPAVERENRRRAPLEHVVRRLNASRRNRTIFIEICDLMMTNDYTIEDLRRLIEPA